MVTSRQCVKIHKLGKIMNDGIFLPDCQSQTNFQSTLVPMECI